MIIVLRVVKRHKPFIHEENVCSFPRQSFFQIRQFLVQKNGSPSPGKGDGKESFRPYGLLGEPPPFLDHGMGHMIFMIKHDDLGGVSFHGLPTR